MDIQKIRPDKEQARSILRIAALIEDRIALENKPGMESLVVADYYEIIKELVTAIMLSEGYKTLSHKELIEYLKEMKEFKEHEIRIADDLRILRNKISYQGFLIDPDYLKRNADNFKLIKEKLKNILTKKLGLNPRQMSNNEMKHNEKTNLQ
ncbi:MAG: hypothetical protein AABW75_00060 [Nanoarchaeota archaeon]